MSAPHTQDKHPHASAGEHHGVGHVVSPKILIATAAALLVLTVVTVASAKVDFSVFELTEMNIIAALSIAVIKASLVCLFFMHLRWDRPFNAFVLIGSLAFVALFIWFAMTDSTEYKPQIIKGDSPAVITALDKLPK
jgi:cytochrome c oxidase subunit 4